MDVGVSSAAISPSAMPILAERRCETAQECRLLVEKRDMELQNRDVELQNRDVELQNRQQEINQLRQALQSAHGGE